MSSFLMLLMTAIENPVLIYYYTMIVILHSTQKHVLLYISFQPFWEPLLKSADSRYPFFD